MATNPPAASSQRRARRSRRCSARSLRTRAGRRRPGGRWSSSRSTSRAMSAAAGQSPLGRQPAERGVDVRLVGAHGGDHRALAEAAPRPDPSGPLDVVAGVGVADGVGDAEIDQAGTRRTAAPSPGAAAGARLRSRRARRATCRSAGAERRRRNLPTNSLPMRSAAVSGQSPTNTDVTASRRRSSGSSSSQLQSIIACSVCWRWRRRP